MTKHPLVIDNNSGGFSTDEKEGQSNSFAFGRHIDFRKKPTSITILPKTLKESSTTVDELVTDMVQLPSGKIVAIGESGAVYTRSTGGTWAKASGSLGTTAFGMIYNLQHDTIYVPNENNVSTITNADGRFGGSLTLNADAFTSTVDGSASDDSNTYTSQASIDDNSSNHRLSITPDYEPLETLRLTVDTKGTGDLVLTIHDAANNTLESVTVDNGDLTNGQPVDFVFDPPVRMMAQPTGATYHFHLTHTGGTATTVDAGTSGNFSTAKYHSRVSRLISPNNGFHPVVEFLQYYCIGNERYLTVWEPITQIAPGNLEWERHRLIFPQGYEVTGLAVWNEYLAIATERRSTSNDIEFQDGKIFFWSGTSATYDYFIDVPEGSPYSVFAHKNILYYYAGGDWYGWSGGEPTKLFHIPNTDPEFSGADIYTRVYPHMMGVRNGVLLGGYPSVTNNQSVEFALYSFGSRNRNYPDSFGENYTISTGALTYNGSDALRIGCVKSFGDKTFISWEDADTGEIGIDVVKSDNAPFADATWESTVFDNNRPHKDKKATYMKITFKPLPSGASVTPKYKINRASSWVLGSTEDTDNATELILPLNKRFKDIQLGYNLAATTTTPEILSVTLVFDDLMTEKE